ncbi:8835_t:CDS:2 [Paraglomus brasilianum]|uniref:8835_t:CDS:1 n=1 Tax=Paraglomus brasilianum TaxID=144538 RepID=A0A9N8ZFY5_9GLOM|nr:8835_t:CDS:2 [Paraglomus brasilianum]
MTNHKEDWLLWQLSDSALPTGGFVASSGLESAIHSGNVHDITSLSNFLSSSIKNYAYSALPFVSDAYIAAESISDEHECYEHLERLDKLYDACTSNNVTKRASKAQGVAMLTLYSKSFAEEDDQGNNVVSKFKKEVRKRSVDGHFPVCFGLVARLVGLTLERTQHLFLFLFARAILSAAVRLNIVGPYYSQRLLTDCQLYVETTLKETNTLRSEDAAQTSPLLDIFQGRHDNLYSRLFNS